MRRDVTDPSSLPSDRRVIYCLLCHKPQRHISTHLARCCIKGQSPSEQQKELQRAKCSMKEWTLKGRRWDYRQLCRWCTDPAGRYELLNYLREAGFFVLHPPDEHELSTLKEAAALAEEAAELKEAAALAEEAADSNTGFRQAHTPVTLGLVKASWVADSLIRLIRSLCRLDRHVTRAK
ncbi:hypothetical protein GOODEAATRI_032224 [Goodea atripinnis]|uniref:Uncharacterized protein n=1 Tax=Goodea atripinnis TaxID=208336 RepID=A0ABV0N615_9TELE